MGRRSNKSSRRETGGCRRTKQLVVRRRVGRCVRQVSRKSLCEGLALGSENVEKTISQARNDDPASVLLFGNIKREESDTQHGTSSMGLTFGTLHNEEAVKEHRNQSSVFGCDSIDGSPRILKHTVSTEISENFPLHLAVLTGKLLHITKECSILFTNGVSLNSKNVDGQTAVHLAVECGYLNVTKCLLAWGLDPSVQNSDGNTALHLAIRKENYDRSLFGCFKLLLHGRFSWRMLNTINDQGFSPLHLAAHNGATEEICLILEAGVNINEGDYLSGRTALFHAVEQGHIGVISLLMRAGADKDKRSWAGKSPEMIAKLVLNTSLFTLMKNDIKMCIEVLRINAFS